ncbi:phosphatase PAP2 family protein [Adhaeribacter aquaticus]|uniref:phosphatase PAP2 family protein n=1 Tax=Adhaeribacter aquaticus TaxID=299567 RepID=UPI00047DB733|nr:phosphatase PAP2 family protein [Adhaeribacter aquaticus]
MSEVFKKVIAVFTLIGLELAVLAGVAVVSVFIFLYIAKLVFIDQNQALDAVAFSFAEAHTTPARTSFFKFVTFFASKDFLIYGSLGLAALFLVFKKHRWYALKVPVISAGSSALNQGMKAWFNRPRPETAFYEQSGLSFPSGHAMIGGAFYGLLIYLVWTNIRSLFWRWVLSGLLFIWIILIGFSRIYLHVHYASDVVAGWAAGFIFLIISILLLRRLEPKYARKATDVMDESPVESSHRNN